MKSRTKWTTGDGRVLTDEEVEGIIRDLLKGISTAAVARPFGRTTGWAWGVANSNGLVWLAGPDGEQKRWRRGVRPDAMPSSVPDVVAADIVGHLVSGKSAEVVATMYSTTRTLIRDVAHRAGYGCYPPNQNGKWMKSSDIPVAAQERFDDDLSSDVPPRSRAHVFSQWLDPEDADALDREILTMHAEWKQARAELEQAQQELRLVREEANRIAVEVDREEGARQQAERNLVEYVELLQISDVENKRLRATIADWEPKVREWEAIKTQQKRHKILQSFDLILGRNGGRDEEEKEPV